MTQALAFPLFTPREEALRIHGELLARTADASLAVDELPQRGRSDLGHLSAYPLRVDGPEGLVLQPEVRAFSIWQDRVRMTLLLRRSPILGGAHEELQELVVSHFCTDGGERARFEVTAQPGANFDAQVLASAAVLQAVSAFADGGVGRVLSTLGGSELFQEFQQRLGGAEWKSFEALAAEEQFRIEGEFLSALRSWAVRGGFLVSELETFDPARLSVLPLGVPTQVSLASAELPPTVSAVPEVTQVLPAAEALQAPVTPGDTPDEAGEVDEDDQEPLQGRRAIYVAASFEPLPAKLSPLVAGVGRSAQIEQIFGLVQQYGPRIVREKSSDGAPLTQLSVREAEELCARLHGTGDPRFQRILPSDFPKTTQIWESKAPDGRWYVDVALDRRLQRIHEMLGDKGTSVYELQGFRSILKHATNFRLFEEENEFGNALNLKFSTVHREREHPLLVMVRRDAPYAEICNLGLRSWDLPTAAGLSVTRGRRVIMTELYSELVEELVKTAATQNALRWRVPGEFIQCLEKLAECVRKRTPVHNSFGTDLLAKVVGNAGRIPGAEALSAGDRLIAALRYVILQAVRPRMSDMKPCFERRFGK